LRAAREWDSCCESQAISADCGEPYINEKIAKEVKTLAKEELNGRVCLQE